MTADGCTESTGPSEATRLEAEFPVSYAIFAMARTHRAIAAANLAALGLFPNQEIMIAQLSLEQGVSQKTLAQSLRVSHATVAKMVARLERAGFVRREASEIDKRVTLVFLTDAGAALGDRVDAAWSDLDRITTAHLDQQTVDSFLAAAAAIRANLEADAGEEDRCP